MEKRVLQVIKKKLRNVLSIVLAITLIMGTLTGYLIYNGKVAKAATGAITSMEYYSASDGPILTNSGVDGASYGFVMPKFNGGSASWADVASDLQVNVKVNGTWVDIDNVSGFVYNSNWGNWSDSGFNGYWFNVNKTTYLQLQSKTNKEVTLEYTLQYTQLSSEAITSMTATQGPQLTAGVTGSCGFTYPTFNGDTSIKYEQVAKDLKVYVRTEDDTNWIDIDNNAASGWIYDKNFGQFWDGPGGYWFNVEKTTYVRLASLSSPGVYLDYTITYNKPVRDKHVLSADTTTYAAGETGAIGIPLPFIDGGYPVASELDNFIYEIRINGTWVELSNTALSGFNYQGNGYNKLSDKNQWGYWVDGIYGLWFQPIQEDMELRIGYPMNGEKGGDVGNNYIVYSFIGNPDAPRPDVSDLGELELGTSDSSELDGWNLIWNDEFAGDNLNTSKWNYNTGYYIDGDPNKWGWGNNELEYYTDSEKNTFVKDGSLNITTYYEPTTFPEIDPNRVAPYSSGKITSKDKFTFKYGRIDFRAKLPAGNGLWPALWLLPNEDTYGVWASSGEIDVMEARGRIPNASSGAIHYGGTWPTNTYLGGDYVFPEGESINSDYHVYSLVWEEDNIKWYVDGKCFFKATNEQWYSAGNPNNPNAPFDQEFYIIMNLAVGGWFDGGVTPGEGDIPASMNVDYVRVYQAEGSTNGSYTDNTTELPPVNPPDEETQGNETFGLVRTKDTVEFYVNGATFADLHYKINGGEQMNVAMTSVGNNKYLYKITGLSAGDKIDYSFTYNPGQGAIDSPWNTYTVASSGNNTDSEDKAFGKTVQSSGTESEAFSASNLVDNNTGTRYASNFADDAWFVVDLNNTYTINQVILNWEAAYGKQYEILVSTDGVNYNSVIKQSNGAGGVETWNIDNVKARYVKFQGVERSLPYGYSLWDIKVIGK